MAISYGATKTIWLRLLIKDFLLFQLEATTIKCNNGGCLAFAKNPKYPAKTLHINIQHYFIRKKIEMEVVIMMFCGIKDFLANFVDKIMYYRDTICQMRH